jgi:hypothetical protein
LVATYVVAFHTFDDANVAVPAFVILVAAATYFGYYYNFNFCCFFVLQSLPLPMLLISATSDAAASSSYYCCLSLAMEVLATLSSWHLQAARRSSLMELAINSMFSPKVSCSDDHIQQTGF